MKTMKTIGILLTILAVLNMIPSIFYYIVYDEIKLLNIIAAIMCGIGACDYFMTYVFVKKSKE